MVTEDAIELRKDIVGAIERLGVKVIDSYVEILQTSLKTGGVNAAQGLLGEMKSASILHGGAYRWDFPPSRLPYYNAAVQQLLGFGTSLEGAFVYSILPKSVTITIPDGYPGQGVTISLPPGASTLQAEVMIDGFVPHILPKVLDDQTYIQIMERCGQLLNIAEFTSLGTGVKTWVEAGSEAANAFRGFQSAGDTRALRAAEAASLDADTEING